MRLTTVAILLIAAGVAIGADAPPEQSASGERLLELTRASKGLHIHNERRGRAVVQGANLAPGARALGKVGLTANSPARITLATPHVGLTPGPNGGVLANALTLRIRMSSGHGYSRVYQGPMTGLGTLGLGRWRGGERHKFHFRVEFPPSSGPQDSLQGAKTGFRLLWRAHG